MTRFFWMTRHISLRFWSRYLALAILTFLTAGFQTSSWGCNGNPVIPPLQVGSFERFFYHNGATDAIYPANIVATVVDPRTGDIYVGGSFFGITNVAASDIAVYRKVKNEWESLKRGGLKSGSPVEPAVNALAIQDNYLYVGGNFTQTQDGMITGLNNIARYNIETELSGEWSPLPGNGHSNGTGLNGTVRALLIYNVEFLYVGGDFTMTSDSSPTTLNRIARYDLTYNLWSSLGTGLNNKVNALAINGANLYIGGEFSQTQNGATMNLNSIARYNITNGLWSNLEGNGLNGPVYALVISFEGLTVGGVFSRTFDGAVANLNNIARYNLFSTPAAWFPLTGGGLNGPVRALARSDDSLFVGGSFSQTFNGMMPGLNNIARYSVGTNGWLALEGFGLDGRVSALSIVNSGSDTKHVYIGGEFSRTVDGVTMTDIHGIARYELSLASTNKAVSTDNGGSTDSWSQLGLHNGNALNNPVTALAAATTGDIYVGGGFSQTDDGATTNLNGIARYNPVTGAWSPLANDGLYYGGTVEALAISGDNLYVGGAFLRTADGTVTNLNRIARYNITTNTWSPLTGGGLNGVVYALAISGDNLYVAGNFSGTFDGATTNLKRIARYNLTTNTWSPLTGNGLNSAVLALAISGDDLYVGGSFNQTGDNSVNGLNYIARYNTITDTWSELTDLGLNNVVNSLAVSDGFLFVNGAFTRPFNTVMSLDRLARYNTADNTWAAITGNADVREAAIKTKAAIRSGNDLYVGGSFKGVNGGVALYFTRIYLQQWKVPANNADWFDGANWTLGTVPSANTNAFIPTGAGNINITSADVTLRDLGLGGGTLTIGAGRTLTINGILNLGGGIINGDGTVVITNCIQDGIMGGDAVGYIQTALVRCVNNTGTFNFPVGTINGYSPVTVKNITGAGNISIKANQGAYSNPASGLPVNRLARWWQIENPGGGITNSDLYFGYLQSDVAGFEENNKAYRIAGGAATMIPSAVNTFSNVLTAQNVTGFSDWTLANAGPTAASVSVGGRVLTANGNGIAKALVSITNGNGETRTALTNAFGYYLFDEIPVGETYIFTAQSKHYQFANGTQVLFVDDARNDINFTALP